MAFVNTWNAAFEASPADIDNISDGATKIRALKVAIEERMQVDHYWDPAGTDADHGQHIKATLRVQTVKPTTGASKGALYAKTVSGHVELFYENEAGTEIQVTSGSALNGVGGGGTPAAEFPSGTTLPFYQNAAPSGWSIQSTLNDKVLMVTKGSVAGGNAGGAAHPTGTWTQPDGTLTANQIPQHTHNVVVPIWICTYGDMALARNWNDVAYPSGAPTAIAGSASNHTYTSAVNSTTASAHNHGTTWRPAGYCVILATKA